MNNLSLIMQLRLRLLRNLWRSIRARHSTLRIASVGGMVFGLWAGLFFVFFAIFNWVSIQSVEFFGLAVNLLLAIFFLVMFVLLTFANALLCFESFFRGWESASMVSRPLDPSVVFWHKTSEAAMYSLWGMVLLCMPLLLALGVCTGAPAAYYGLGAALLVLFVLLSVGLGAVVALLFSRCALPSPRKVLIVFLAAGLLALALGMGDIVRREWMADEHSIALWLQGPLARLVVAQNPLLPSLWLSRGLMRTADGAWRGSALYLGLLATNTLFLGMVAHWLAGRAFVRAYHCAQDTRSVFHPSPRRLVYRAARALAFPLSPAQRMIVLKDLKAFLRTPTQWGQMVVFSGVLLVYFVNIWYFQDVGELGMQPGTRSLLNLVAILFTLTTFTVRFAYPSISLEGRSMWVLGLLPSKRRAILEAKFFASLAGSLAFGVPLVLGSHYALASHGDTLLLFMTALVLACAGLSALAVGLGAVYPSSEADDAAKSAAGFGGTLNLVFSVGFVAFVVLALVVPNLYGTDYAPLAFLGDHQRAFTTLGAALGTMLLCGAMFWRGGRALDRLEI